MNQFGLKERLKEEMDRFNKFQAIMGLQNGKWAKPKNLNPKVFVKYILREGSITEKCELLSKYAKQDIAD